MSDRVAEESFRTLFEPHRRSITLHCYRMLGSLQDAEEVVQESLLRAWQRQDEVRSPSATRAWLYKIATNACLDVLKARRRRGLPHLVAPSAGAITRLGPPADEGLWVEPTPDALLDVEDATGERPDERVSLRESIGLAFIAALQLLTPKQRAALLLVDVLGWGPEEAAELLETSVFSLNSLLQRARKKVEARGGEGAPKEAASPDAALLRRFIAATRRCRLRSAVGIQRGVPGLRDHPRCDPRRARFSDDSVRLPEALPAVRASGPPSRG